MLERSLEQKHDARAQAECAEIHEAVALKTEEITVRVLDKVDAAIDRDDVNAARDLQAYTQATKNIYSVARQARGLDLESRERAGNGQTLVFIDLPRVEAKREPVNVTPQPAAIELPPANPSTT